MPADPAHDDERGACLQTPTNPPDPPDLCPSQADRLPFLTNPTSCVGPVTTLLRANSWQNGAFERRNSTTPVGADGCNAVPFDPTVDVQSSESSSDSPTAISVDVNIPQPQNPTGIAQANLKTAEVTLPEGTTINPSVAAGLDGCTVGQVGLNDTDPPSCPNASKIGDVEIASPLQPAPLQGAIYQATPNANPFGSLLAIYLVARRRSDGEARGPDRGRPGDRPGDDDDRQRPAAAVLALQPRLQGRLTGPLGHPPDLRDQDRVGVPDAVERQPPDRAHGLVLDHLGPQRRTVRLLARRPGRLPPA